MGLRKFQNHWFDVHVLWWTCIVPQNIWFKECIYYYKYIGGSFCKMHLPVSNWFNGIYIIADPRSLHLIDTNIKDSYLHLQPFAKSKVFKIQSKTMNWVFFSSFSFKHILLIVQYAKSMQTLFQQQSPEIDCYFWRIYILSLFNKAIILEFKFL